MGNRDEEKDEIVVKAPAKPVIAPEKKAQIEAEKSLEEERYSVLQIPRKVGKYLGLVSILLGVIIFVLLSIASLTSQINWMFLSAISPLSIAVLWIVVGSVTVIVGFFLIGSD